MFRYIGASMIFLPILFIIYMSGREDPRFRPEVRHMVAVLLLASVVTAVPIAYKSPYVYQPSDHVTEGEFDGYRFVFENRHERPLRAVETSPDRYEKALYGGGPPVELEDPEGETDIPVVFNITGRDLDTTRGTVVVTEYARVRYLQLYPGLGYSEADFAYLESGPRIDKLYSNGGTEVYSSR
jgi:hypothetical protein